MTSHTALKAQETRPLPTIEQFESLDIDPAGFDHEAHVYVAWSYLQICDLLEAIRRYRETLIRLTRTLGVPGKYHETMTWFYLLAVAERATGDQAADWALFRASNPDLFRRNPSLIRRFYSEGRLASELARAQFVLPDAE